MLNICEYKDGGDDGVFWMEISDFIQNFEDVVFVGKDKPKNDKKPETKKKKDVKEEPVVIKPVDPISNVVTGNSFAASWIPKVLGKTFVKADGSELTADDAFGGFKIVMIVHSASW